MGGFRCEEIAQRRSLGGRTRDLQVLARQIEEFRNFYSGHGLDEFNIRITTHKEVHTLHKVAQPKAIVNFHELIVFKDTFSRYCLS